METSYSENSAEWSTNHQSIFWPNFLQRQGKDHEHLEENGVGLLYLSLCFLFPGKSDSCLDWGHWSSSWWSSGHSVFRKKKKSHPQFLESLNFSPGQKWVSFNIADFLSPEVSVRILISYLKEERWYSKYTWHSGVNWVFNVKMKPFILRGDDDLSNHAGVKAFCQKNH